MSVEDDEFDSELQRNIFNLGRHAALNGFCRSED